MNAKIPENADSRSASFRQITDAFLSQDGLPFSEVLTAEKIQNVFGRKNWRAPDVPRRTSGRSPPRDALLTMFILNRGCLVSHCI